MDSFVVSTDKAVRPTNVMGVVRSELVLQALHRHTRDALAWFVSGTSSILRSVVPVFKSRSRMVAQSPSLTRKSSGTS